MNKLILAGLLAIIGIGVGMVVITPQEAPPAQVANNTTLPEQAVIYDVRTLEEFNVSRVADAKLLPVQEIEAGRLPEVEKDTPIALYCRSGNRSAHATHLLKKAGFTNITDMGGLGDIQRYGLVAENLGPCTSC